MYFYVLHSMDNDKPYVSTVLWPSEEKIKQLLSDMDPGNYSIYKIEGERIIPCFPLVTSSEATPT